MDKFSNEPFLLFRRHAENRQLVFEHYPNAYADGVIDCVSAAKARNIDLVHELKHLLLYTDAGYFLAHITGNVRLSLRRVKRHLQVKEAHLADLNKFPGTLVQRGTVCPFIEPLWSSPHLVDRSVLQISSMTTNDGTTRGYIKFDPKILFLAPNYTVGNFAAEH